MLERIRKIIGRLEAFRSLRVIFFIIIFLVGVIPCILLQNGILRNDGSEDFSSAALMDMDWLCDNIEGRIPSYDELLPEYMRLAEAEQRLKAGTLSDKIKKPY